MSDTDPDDDVIPIIPEAHDEADADVPPQDEADADVPPEDEAGE